MLHEFSHQPVVNRSTSYCATHPLWTAARNNAAGETQRSAKRAPDWMNASPRPRRGVFGQRPHFFAARNGLSRSNPEHPRSNALTAHPQGGGYRRRVSPERRGAHLFAQPGTDASPKRVVAPAS